MTSKTTNTKIVKVDAKVEAVLDFPDPETGLDYLDYESRELDNRGKKADVAVREAKAADLQALAEGHVQDNEARKEYAGKFFYLTSKWLLAIYALLLLQGFKPWHFSLDSKIILALIGATTVNVLGFLAQVAAYLYHKPKK